MTDCQMVAKHNRVWATSPCYVTMTARTKQPKAPLQWYSTALLYQEKPHLGIIEMFVKLAPCNEILNLWRTLYLPGFRFSKMVWKSVTYAEILHPQTDNRISSAKYNYKQSSANKFQSENRFRQKTVHWSKIIPLLHELSASGPNLGNRWMLQ